MLRKIIKEELEEAYQQKIFGGEEKVVSPIEKLVRISNKEFEELNLGFSMLRKFYRLHRDYNNMRGGVVPKITQIIPMEGGTYEIVFGDGTQEVFEPYRRQSY